MGLAEQCIADVIMIYENDICCELADELEYEAIRLAFADLIVYMTRQYLDVRYCSRDDCPCSPISHLANHFIRHKELFEKYLHKNAFSLLDEISKHYFEVVESA